MKIKNIMVRSHEKMVSASYPELIKRGTVINIFGTVACYLTGLGLHYFHKKVIAPKLENMSNPKNDEN